MQTFEVRCTWDSKVGIWWADSDSVPGLVAEAKMREQLKDEFRRLVPVLLQANSRRWDGHAKLRLTWHETEELTLCDAD